MNSGTAFLYTRLLQAFHTSKSQTLYLQGQVQSLNNLNYFSREEEMLHT